MAAPVKPQIKQCLNGDLDFLIWGIKSNTHSECFLTGSNPTLWHRVDDLAKALQSNNVLTALYLRGESIKGEGVLKILNAVAHNRDFKILDLANTRIHDPDWDAIADALSKTSIERFSGNLKKEVELKILKKNQNIQF